MKFCGQMKAKKKKKEKITMQEFTKYNKKNRMKTKLVQIWKKTN